ncbi:MAG TPA: hypothetical protein PLH20_15860, partial [Flavobacterium sp.]|nr:hypothetical protein [Flavobacterium sp.]
KLNQKKSDIVCQMRMGCHCESILAVIKWSGYAGRMKTHGFRSLFSTALNESNLFNPDAIERQLAHVPQIRIRSAYN